MTRSKLTQATIQKIQTDYIAGKPYKYITSTYDVSGAIVYNHCHDLSPLRDESIHSNGLSREDIIHYLGLRKYFSEKTIHFHVLNRLFRYAQAINDYVEDSSSVAYYNLNYEDVDKAVKKYIKRSPTSKLAKNMVIS